MNTDSNQYQLLKAIDDILARCHAVKPRVPLLDYQKLDLYLGKDSRGELKSDKVAKLFSKLARTQVQYLVLVDPKNSLESELIAWSTTLSEPLFEVDWEDYIKGAFRSDQLLNDGYAIQQINYCRIIPKDDLLPYYLTPTPRLWLADGQLRERTFEPSRDHSQALDLETGRSLPAPQGDQLAFRVTYHLHQVLHGIRAVLLVLIDSCGQCAIDPDWIGGAPAQDSLWAAHAMRQWKEEDFVRNAKYWKDWPLARFLRNERPPIPKSWGRSPDDPLFAGRTGEYFRRLANFSSNRHDSTPVFRATFGIAQSKRGFARVPQSFISSTLEKHAHQMALPPATTPMQDGFDIELARLFMATILKDFEFPDTFREVVKLEGSTAAAVFFPRSEGGTRGAIRSEMNIHLGGTGARQWHDPDYHFGRETLAEWEDPKKLSDRYTSEKEYFLGFREIVPGQAVEERGTLPYTEAGWRSLARKWATDKPTYYRLDAGYHQQFTDLYEDSKNCGVLDEDNYWSPMNLRKRDFARVATIVEPLKVRTITAMDPITSHLSRPLQMKLWSYLQKTPVFSLIGEPISESVLDDLQERHRRYGPKYGIPEEGADFVSGDYSAATDGLDIRLSKLFLETLLEKVPAGDELLRGIFRSALLEQIILYPRNEMIDPVPQMNGQLMGSVLSFPFLCLANLFSYAVSLGQGNREATKRLLGNSHALKNLPVLINGDDILFRTTPAHYQSWLSEIARVGFVPSVGKNFVHSKFFTVNSVPIEYTPAPATNTEFWENWSWADMAEIALDRRPDTLRGTFQIHGFLNVGLLTGQSKLTGRDSLRTLPLSGWHAQSVVSALNPPQAHKWFLHYHLPSIQRQTRFGGTTLNLFAHPLKGGLGFTVPPGVEARFSPEQRRIAEALYLSASASYSGQEAEFDWDPLVSVASASTGAPPLATKRRRVDLELYPVGTPLPPYRVPFVDASQAKRQNFTVPYSVTPDDSDGKAVSCRLSGRQIRDLTKRWGRYVIDLHPLDQMTTFPFVVLRKDLTPETGRPESYYPQDLYSPEVPFIDVPTTQEMFEEEFPFPDGYTDVPESTINDLGRHDLDFGIDPPPPTPEDLPDFFPIEDWETGSLRIPIPSMAELEGEIVDLGPEPDDTFINRSHAGRKRAHQGHNAFFNSAVRRR